MADSALAYLLDHHDGPGSCGTCHSSGVRDNDDDKPISREYGGSLERPHMTFSHAPHINLIGPDASCGICHIINNVADYMSFFEGNNHAQDTFNSNFVSISKDACDQCHRPGIVRFNCQLCHTYHRDPGFKVGFQERRGVHE